MTIEEPSFEYRTDDEMSSSKGFRSVRLLLFFPRIILIFFWIIVEFLGIAGVTAAIAIMLPLGILILLGGGWDHSVSRFYKNLFMSYSKVSKFIAKRIRIEGRGIAFIFSSEADFKEFMNRKEDNYVQLKQRRASKKWQKKKAKENLKLEKKLDREEGRGEKSKMKDSELDRLRGRVRETQKKLSELNIKETSKKHGDEASSESIQQTQELGEYLRSRKGERMNIFDLVDQLNTPLAEIEDQLRRLLASNIIKGTYDEKTGEILVE
ncbi:MAG: hypothetical protein GPJ51_07020 [Candidatus Heimdallarchaeota archaeon]|nr:hypothetical protein [Candidatus Heimdallarchaeota archaeon]